jgi:sugar/nucleoside kinase (ribokinase family)
MKNKFNVVGVGRAYTDLVAHVSAEFLEAHRIPLDGQREVSIEELKLIQSQLKETQMIAGGPSANTVANIKALGGSAGYFGKVYKDAAGECFLNDFQNREITLCCDPYAIHPALSASCLVLLTDQHRSFAYNPGCADYFAANDFAGFDFTTTDFFLVEAHLLTSVIAKPAILTALEQAKNKTATVINLQGITQWQNHPDIIKVISTANFIIGNEQEQSAFANAVNLQQLSSHIITTKGAHGAEISLNGHALHHEPAIAPEQFVNSLGAGDAFIAGFLLSHAKGSDIKDSMKQAVLAATTILTESGARLIGTKEYYAKSYISENYAE